MSSRTPAFVFLETGDTATLANIDFCYFDDEYDGDPWFDLDIYYEGTDRALYDNGGAYIERDQYNEPIVEGGDCDSFYATAVVPTDVVYGGNWIIQDGYGFYPFDVLYVQGAI